MGFIIARIDPKLRSISYMIRHYRHSLGAKHNNNVPERLKQVSSEGKLLSSPLLECSSGRAARARALTMARRSERSRRVLRFTCARGRHCLAGSRSQIRQQIHCWAKMFGISGSSRLVYYCIKLITTTCAVSLSLSLACSCVCVKVRCRAYSLLQPSRSSQ